jgi:hypothetical protein
VSIATGNNSSKLKVSFRLYLKVCNFMVHSRHGVAIFGLLKNFLLKDHSRLREVEHWSLSWESLSFSQLHSLRSTLIFPSNLSLHLRTDLYSWIFRPKSVCIWRFHHPNSIT